jgi:ParB/RepB/Spo0J family partition protein
MPSASVTVTLDRLEVDGQNVRQVRPADADLVSSIAAQGLLVPLLVRPAAGGTFKVIDGGRRLEAARAAGVDEVPVQVVNVDDATAWTLSLTANVARRSMDPIEEAHAYRVAMARHGLTQQQLADTVGVSQTHISHRLKLLQLSPAQQEKVAAGDVSVYRALQWVPKDPNRSKPHNYPAGPRPRSKDGAGTVAAAEKLATLAGSGVAGAGLLDPHLEAAAIRAARDRSETLTQLLARAVPRELAVRWCSVCDVRPALTSIGRGETCGPGCTGRSPR